MAATERAVAFSATAGFKILVVDSRELLIINSFSASETLPSSVESSCLGRVSCFMKEPLAMGKETPWWWCCS